MENLSGCPVELDALSLEVGKFVRYWGFKTIHGRIWTHLYLSQQPLDAGTLIKRLKVSKALMSLSLNDLLDFKVIQEAGKSSRGTVVYNANPQVLDVILNVLAQREKVMLAEINAASEKVCAVHADTLEGHAICKNKMKALSSMVQHAQGILNSLLNVSSTNFSELKSFNSKPRAEQSL